VTARGRSLDAVDVVASLERARRLAARPILSAFGAIRRVRADALALEIAGAAPEAVAEALACPATAVVPRAFSPRIPDGTGPFRADHSAAGLVLSRNERAARGPSFLDKLDVRHASDLASGLRAFESGEADMGFLGAGLHRRRADAVDFRTEPFGWVVFRTGPEAGEWGSPGVAARLVEAIDPGRLSQLGLVPLVSAKRDGDQGWGGATTNLYVDEASPYLVEVARAVATALSRPGHELRPTQLSHGELSRLRDGRRFSLMIDFVRRLGPTPHHAALSLLGAATPGLTDKPFTVPRDDIEIVERTLSLAALGELKVIGARAPDIHGLEQWELGSVFRSA
jgi:peptide/nickel transport system substrate-binding protein